MKLGLFYAHAASNWGDLAINKGVINLLKITGHDLGAIHGVRLPHNTVHTINSDLSLDHLRVIPADVPSDNSSELGTLNQAYEYLTDIEKFVTDFEIDRVDLVLLNSGEHLFEGADGTNIGDLAWRILPLVAAAQARVPVVQLPATLGPFHTRRVSRLFKYYLSNLDNGAVRDGLSGDLIQPLGRTLERVLDPGFFGVDNLPLKAASAPKEAIALIPRLEDFGLRAGPRRSAFVLAKNREERYVNSKAFQVYYRVAQEILENSSDTVHLIVQTWADRELIQNLYSALSESNEASRIWLHDPVDYDTYTETLTGMDVVVTSRFHAAILALTQGVPAVGVYSDAHGHKMPGLFSMLGFAANCVRMQDRLTETVAAEIKQALDFSKKNSANIYESVISWRVHTEGWFKDLASTSNESAESHEENNHEVIHQVRIDLLYELHRRIVSYNNQNNDREILTSLKRIEKRLSAIK